MLVDRARHMAALHLPVDEVCALSPDGKLLITRCHADNGEEFYVWDVLAAKVHWTAKVPASPQTPDATVHLHSPSLAEFSADEGAGRFRQNHEERQQR